MCYSTPIAPNTPQAHNRPEPEPRTPMVRTVITTNARECAAWVESKYRSQIPFATALALTDVAFKAQREVKTELAASMQLRNRFSASGIQVNPAEKGRLEDMQAEVGIEERRSYLIDHVLAGKRQGGRFGRAILEEESLRSGSGRVPKGKRPGALIAMANRAKAKGQERGRGQAKPKPFLIYSQSWGGELLMQRNGGQLQVLYAFRKGVDIKRTFEMDTTARTVVAASYYAAFERAMGKAIRSAR